VSIVGVAPCPVYGKHRMVSQGPCVCRDYKTNEVIKVLAGWYKCSCGERFICQGYPHFGGAIGYYVTEGAIKGVSVINGAYAFLVDKSLMRYTDSSTISGYSFISQ
jgi:hypothetical protein